jgi:predicted MPP superfamily phosphohydrolase
VRFWHNTLTELCFYLAMAWIALAVNLLLAADVGWLLIGLARLAGRSLDLKWFALVALALSVFFAAHGVWRARHPQLHRIEVTIKDLPQAWQGRSIVHLSDLHLGFIHGAGFMQQVAEKVNALEADMVLITGDLLDGMGGNVADYLDAIDLLEARHGVFFVIGNHEIYNQASPLLDGTRLRILRDEVVEVEGLQIVGVGFPGLGSDEELDLLRAKISAEQPSILLFHTPTDILQRGEDIASLHMNTYMSPDTSCAVNRELGIDLQLSGHTHAGQIFPFGLITRLIYRGRDRGLHRDGDFKLYVSSGTGTFGPPVRSSGRSEIVVITLR